MYVIWRSNFTLSSHILRTVVEVGDVVDHHVRPSLLQVVFAVQARLLGEEAGYGQGLAEEDLAVVVLQNGQLAERRALAKTTQHKT